MPSDPLDKVCRHCGERAQRALLFALMEAMGAKPSWDPSRCAHGEHSGELHEFVDPEPAKEADDAE